MKNSKVYLPIDKSFSFEECLWFLNRNFDDCMHEARDGRIRKALLIDNEPVLLEVSLQQDQLQIQVIAGAHNKAILAHAKNYIAEWLDIDQDLKPFYKLLKKHPALAYMPLRYKGLRLIGIPDLFEALAWSIIGQQINLTFAYKLKRRVVELYGTSIEHESIAYHIFPSFETLARADLAELREMQFSTRKAEYLIGLAQAFADGIVSKEILLALPDSDARQAVLTNIRGIGIWTANYALMKSLKDPSSIPYGDAGLLNALIRHNIMEHKKDIAGMEQLFQAFPGWENYLVFYLWRSLAPSEKESHNQ